MFCEYCKRSDVPENEMSWLYGPNGEKRLYLCDECKEALKEAVNKFFTRWCGE